MTIEKASSQLLLIKPPAGIKNRNLDQQLTPGAGPSGRGRGGDWFTCIPVYWVPVTGARHLHASRPRGLGGLFKTNLCLFFSVAFPWTSLLLAFVVPLCHFVEHAGSQQDRRQTREELLPFSISLSFGIFDAEAGCEHCWPPVSAVAHP